MCAQGSHQECPLRNMDDLCAFSNPHRIDVAFVSVIEMGIQVFLGIEGLAAKSTSPLRWSVLMLRFLLRSKDVSTFVERTFQWQFHLILLQYWHPSLKSSEVQLLFVFKSSIINKLIINCENFFLHCVFALKLSKLSNHVEGTFWIINLSRH